MQEKALDKIQHPSIIKALKNWEQKDICEHIKSVYDKPINNKINGEKLKAFLLKSSIRHGSPLSPFLLNIVGMEVQARPLRQEKGRKTPKSERKN